ncbi:putative baseplate assembly protein [Dyella sp. 2RAB6]|uniref:putative baseplate assembly protein n=1 Tax=Dyella sp. 2RAB6 TaxID=3232992 RepID=UPI003F8E1CB7
MSCCSACGKHACACGCGAGASTPRSLYNRPGLDSLVYRVGSYADFRATMQLDLSDAALPALQGLRTRELDDPSMALLDAWAVGADVLSFYQERIANEGYLRTATERCSVLQLGRLVDYRLRPGVAASVYLAYTIDDNSSAVTIPLGAKAQSVPAPGEQMQTFETAEPLDARREWNTLRPRLTQPQNISLGTIGGLGELWVANANTQLKLNDPLLFLFGQLSTGVTALRRVRSVEVQQRDPATGAVLPPEQQRSRVLLQPLDAVTVQILVAANKAIALLAYTHTGWLENIEAVRQKLLLEQGNGGSFVEFTRVFELENYQSAAQPVLDFMQSVQQAFGSSGNGGSNDADFGALFDALIQPVTLQPANSLRLQRSLATALGLASDARPQLLLNFARPLADTFYNAWTQVQHGEPSPALNGVYAMRVAAPLFGYNAPAPIDIVQTYNSTSGEWTSKPSRETLDTTHETANVLWLDNAYDGVSAGGYVMIHTQGTAIPVIGQLQAARTLPHSDYGMSGKSTQLTLAGPTSGSGVPWPVPSEATLRSTLVHAQSELLPLAVLSIADDMGNLDAISDGIPGDGATRVTLDTPVDGLKPGRWVIVQGQRTDVPGTDTVIAAELVMLLAVEQGVPPDLPGDTVHSTLVLANQGLAYTYKRGTVAIFANVVRATNGETRNEVLGSGDGSTPMQVFVLKQPPLTYVPAATVDGVQSTLTVRVNQVEWHEVRNLAFVDGNARRFVTATDDNGKTSVVFGNGEHGARLPTGVENVTAVYRNGIGAPGNVRAGQISLLTTKPLGVKNVINPLRASGGADAETRDQARANVPLAVLALDRLVSITDYADFARTFGGVGKAAAVKLGTQVRVTIAGAADIPVDVTSDLYRNLLQALRQYGDPTLPVSLDVRELLAVTLSAKVGLAPDYSWEAVEPQVRAALLGRFGFERRGLAQNVYLSEIVACIQAVRGVAWVDADAFGHLDEATVLEGFGVGGDNGDKGEGGNNLSFLSTTSTNGPNGGGSQSWVNQRVQALPARYDDDGRPLPAQLARFLPTVPDTLLLQEATP